MLNEQEIARLTKKWEHLYEMAQAFSFDHELFKETAVPTYQVLYSILHKTNQDCIPASIVALLQAVRVFSECSSGGIGKEYIAAQKTSAVLSDPLNDNWQIVNFQDPAKAPTYMQIKSSEGYVFIDTPNFDMTEFASLL